MTESALLYLSCTLCWFITGGLRDNLSSADTGGSESAALLGGELVAAALSTRDVATGAPLIPTDLLRSLSKHKLLKNCGDFNSVLSVFTWCCVFLL